MEVLAWIDNLDALISGDIKFRGLLKGIIHSQAHQATGGIEVITGHKLSILLLIQE